jgi:DNA (cytosine-5)-methyltransferase 1
MTTLPAIDLFAGAGGLSLGALAAGADVRLLVELDPIACETARLNSDVHAGTVVEQDVCEISGAELRDLAGLSPRDPLLLVGGAPCQPFSKAAYWVDPGDDARYRRARARGEQATRPTAPIAARPDPRRSLVQEFWRLVVEADADAFVFENVPSILHPRNRHVVEQLTRQAEAEGYGVRVVRANAVEFGVPQRRQRVFVLAAKGRRPDEPAPTHSERPGSELLPLVTAGEAIRGFAGQKHFEPEEVIAGRWAEHLRTIPPGWNYKFHTAWAGHPSPTFETETRYWHFLLKLSPDKPSWTVPATPGPWVGPFHWDSRRLRTPELAALQCFPKGYRFAGSRRERVRQIGNAVPPLLAQQMLEQVLAAATGSPSRAA